MKPQLEKFGKEICEKVQCVYAFEIRAAKADQPTIWTVDLKNGNGAVHDGKVDSLKVDATFIMLDDDFVALTQQKLKPQTAFMTGKMKIRGNMKAAMKFKPEIMPKDAKL